MLKNVARSEQAPSQPQPQTRHLRAVTQGNPTRRDLYRMAKDFLARGIITRPQHAVLQCLIKRTNVGEGFKGRVSIAEMTVHAVYSRRAVQHALNGDRPNNKRALLAGGFEPLNLVRREGSGQGADGENEVPLYILNIKVWKQLYTQPKSPEVGVQAPRPKVRNHISGRKPHVDIRKVLERESEKAILKEIANDNPKRTSAVRAALAGNHIPSPENDQQVARFAGYTAAVPESELALDSKEPCGLGWLGMKGAKRNPIPENDRSLWIDRLVTATGMERLRAQHHVLTKSLDEIALACGLPIPEPLSSLDSQSLKNSLPDTFAAHATGAANEPPPIRSREIAQHDKPEQLSIL